MPKSVLKFIRLFLALCFTAVPLLPAAPLAAAPDANFYVATTGTNAGGVDGSVGNPWATITYALTRVPDGSTILVQPGTYNGQVDLTGNFATGVTVRSSVPYQARLRHTSAVVRCYYGQGITLEGFDIAHAGSGAGALVIQIQDLLGSIPGKGGGSDPYVSRITLRDNVIHDSYNNDLLKINNGAGLVTVEGNVFYNQSGSDEHIDINSVTDVLVRDNVFFNDFAGSGRTNGNDTSSYIVIKDSNGSDDSNEGSLNITVRRNVFLNWQGSTGSNFVLVGEDGNDYFEAQNVLVENNLLVGNAANTMRAAFGVKGGQNITFRHNTVVGNLPSLAFAFRLNREGANPVNNNIRFYNNIWADPTGTMGQDGGGASNDFADGAAGEVTNLVLDDNLYWNNGAAIPVGDFFDPLVLDTHDTVANPQLNTNYAGLVLPRYTGAAFASGNATIRQEFVRLVNLYGALPSGSPALGAATLAQSPADDILGLPRPVNGSDLGAFEYQGEGFTLAASPSLRAIQPGQSAAFTANVQALGGFTSTVSLAASSPAPNLLVGVAPAGVVPTGQATVYLTSTLSPPLLPGLWYTVPITGTAAGLTQTVTIRLLVGGARVYLPYLGR